MDKKTSVKARWDRKRVGVAAFAAVIGLFATVAGPAGAASAYGSATIPAPVNCYGTAAATSYDSNGYLYAHTIRNGACPLGNQLVGVSMRAVGGSLVYSTYGTDSAIISVSKPSWPLFVGARHTWGSFVVNT